MAAPTPGTKPTPVGYKMPDGFPSMLTMSGAPSVALWIQTIKFGGYDGGDKIPTTTMMNLHRRTFAPRSLLTKDDCTFKAAFDPDIFNGTIQGLINLPQTITEFYPDGSSLCYYGFLQKMGEPEFKEGEFPVADFTVVATNWDTVHQVEAIEVFTAASGT